MEGTSKTAVVLDPYPLWLDAVSNVLLRIEVEVVATTTSPTKALELIAELDPDVVVAELSAEDAELDGIGFLNQARAESPPAKIVVFSTYEDRQHIDAAL